ncbi:RNA polymerase sigma factor SigM [Nocardioides bigeumensis]|uniref:RNA polymerase sigma factor SigM n=1 Tax=Nocardioides bigeumensis TaxID=433657 RepID=A0ABP5KR37_9ACTN
MTPSHSADTSDLELLRAHVDGDPEAFGVLFGRHRDRLWAVALRTMGNPEDAADGLQDGLIAAFRRAGSFRGDAAVTTWLHRVVVNACLDRLRAAKVRAADPLPDDLDERESRGSLRTATAASLDPAELSVADERRRTVLAALQTLPEEQRAALVLVDMEGYAMADVAQMLDCAVGTVKSRCSRGRARLAGLLTDRLAALDADPTGGTTSGPGDAGLGNRPAGRPVPSQDPPRGPPASP